MFNSIIHDFGQSEQTSFRLKNIGKFVTVPLRANFTLRPLQFSMRLGVMWFRISNVVIMYSFSANMFKTGELNSIPN